MKSRSSAGETVDNRPSISRYRRRRPPAILAAMALLMMTAAFRPVATAGQSRVLQIAVVTHPQVPVDNLTFPEVRNVFRGERQYWSPNVPIVLLMRAPVAPERDVILKRVYAMSEAQFKQFWIAKIFRDEAAIVPKNLYSNEQISELVATIPGGIGFVDANAVRGGLKVLKIDGQLPGQPGYPLQ